MKWDGFLVISYGLYIKYFSWLNCVSLETTNSTYWEPRIAMNLALPLQVEHWKISKQNQSYSLLLNLYQSIFFTINTIPCKYILVSKYCTLKDDIHPIPIGISFNPEIQFCFQQPLWYTIKPTAHWWSSNRCL